MLRLAMVAWFHLQRMINRAIAGSGKRSEFSHDIIVIGDSAAEGFGDYIVAGLDAGILPVNITLFCLSLLLIFQRNFSSAGPSVAF